MITDHNSSQALYDSFLILLNISQIRNSYKSLTFLFLNQPEHKCTFIYANILSNVNIHMTICMYEHNDYFACHSENHVTSAWLGFGEIPLIKAS